VLDGASLAATLQAPDERTRAVAALLERLAPLLALADQAPALAGMLGDSFDDVMRTAIESGVDVERGVVNGAGAALRFGAVMDAEKVRQLEALLRSGVLDPAALRVVGEIAGAVRETASAPPRAIGLGGLLRALGSPNVRRALGFLVEFADRFGSRLGGAQAPR
jgi:hypothetical protein